MRSGSDYQPLGRPAPRGVADLQPFAWQPPPP
jgi:hypothetical protein